MIYLAFVPEHDDEPRFCSRCGAALHRSLSGGFPRWMCSRCQRPTFRNPAVGVAVVLRDADTILLGRRGRGPYAGHWCIPCGYVEWNEDVRAAARREMREETGLVVEVGHVIAVHSNVHDLAKQTVGIWFAGHIISGTPVPGDDLDQLGYFSLVTPPSLAFPTDATVLAALARALP